MLLLEMLRYCLGTINDLHWVFKPSLSFRKPHSFSTFIEKEKEN